MSCFTEDSTLPEAPQGKEEEEEEDREVPLAVGKLLQLLQKHLKRETVQP